MKTMFENKQRAILAAMLMAMVCTTLAWGAGSVTDTGAIRSASNDYTLTFTWVGDASTGAVPATASSVPIDGYVYLVVTNPGSTSPTDDYDITLTDSDGVDVMGGALTDRDETLSEQVVPILVTGIYGARRVNGTLTLTITHQTDASATGTVVVYFYR